jgi:hypothetical protein
MPAISETGRRDPSASWHHESFKAPKLRQLWSRVADSDEVFNRPAAVRPRLTATIGCLALPGRLLLAGVEHRQGAGMSIIFYYLTFLATASVLAVLGMGLLNLARRPRGDGPAEEAVRVHQTNLSQRLMRWRVGLQFVAVVVIMVTVYLTRG